MKGIIYIRVSSDEQVEGTSLEHQEESCRRYCQQKGIEIVELFREEGESAKDLSLNNRKAFLRALEFCRKQKGNVQAFIVLRVDRFARNTEDHFAVRKLLLDYGTTLHSVTEPIGNKPAEKFIETVLAGAAEYENAIRKQRCTDGMSKKIDQGLWPWRSPAGYTSALTKQRGEKKTVPDAPDEKVFSIIQRGLKEYAKGNCSQAELMKLLDEWGLKAARGKKTLPQFVDRILGVHLKFYAGILHNPFTREEKQGLHTPMITKEDMHQIQAIRAGKAGRLGVKKDRFNPAFPLRKTVVCASCSRPYTGGFSRGRNDTYPYYHCHNRTCVMYGKGIPKEKLEQEFLKHLEALTPRQNFLALLKETVIDVWKEKGQLFEEHAQQYEKQLAELEAKRKRVFEMREDGSYSPDEFRERKGEVESEIAAVKISLSESRIEQFDIEGVLTYATNFISNLGRQWFDLAPTLRPRFQKLLFPEGLPYDRAHGFRTAKLGLVFEINQACLGEKSQLVDSLRNSWNQIIEELQAWQGFMTAHSNTTTTGA